MSKLINEVRKEMFLEAEEQKRVEEKANIRAMLSLIKSLEEQIEGLNEQVKAVKEDLEKKDYTRVNCMSNTLNLTTRSSIFPLPSSITGGITTSA